MAALPYRERPSIPTRLALNGWIGLEVVERATGAPMKLLAIESLRPGADGWRKDVPNAANYDESKVDFVPDVWVDHSFIKASYRLPASLIFQSRCAKPALGPRQETPAQKTYIMIPLTAGWL